MMRPSFPPRAYTLLQPNLGFDQPPTPPELVHLHDPAIQVLTDFRVVWPITISPHATIDVALEKMKSAGVRLLMVITEDQQIVGLVTSHDIQGEKPIQIVESSRIQRERIRVEEVMIPQPEVKVLDMLSVRGAQVGHIVETLRELGLRHILVVERDGPTGGQRVRGLFSASQIAKQLGCDPWEEGRHAQSLAEMVQEIGR
jgi:CBS domain containing-hemolysin-like protein